MRCRQPFRFDLCAFPTFQSYYFRLTLAPFESEGDWLWLTGRLALFALPLFRIVYLRILAQCHQPFRFDLFEFSPFQSYCCRLTLAPFQSAGTSLWLTGRLALFVPPLFLTGGAPPSTVRMRTKRKTLSTLVVSSEFCDFTVPSLPV